MKSHAGLAGAVLANLFTHPSGRTGLPRAGQRMVLAGCRRRRVGEKERVEKSGGFVVVWLSDALAARQELPLVGGCRAAGQGLGLCDGPVARWAQGWILVGKPACVQHGQPSLAVRCNTRHRARERRTGDRRYRLVRRAGGRGGRGAGDPLASQHHWRRPRAPGCQALIGSMDSRLGSRGGWLGEGTGIVG